MAVVAALGPAQRSASPDLALAVASARPTSRHTASTDGTDVRSAVEPRPNVPPRVRVAGAHGREAQDLAEELSWLAHAPRIPPLSGAERLEVLAQLAVLEARIQSEPQVALDAQANVAPDRVAGLIL